MFDPVSTADFAHHAIIVENDGVQMNVIFFFEGENYTESWETIGQGGLEGDVYTLYWADDRDIFVEDTFRFGER